MISERLKKMRNKIIYSANIVFRDETKLNAKAPTLDKLFSTISSLAVVSDVSHVTVFFNEEEVVK